MMGTRAGDIDNSILEYLSHKEGLSISESMTLLNKQSGLLGISGLTGDMRDLLQEVEENNDRRARLAVEIYTRRVKGYIGRYLTEMGGADAVVFTGGVGENSPSIRKMICSGLECIGINVDDEQNNLLKNGTSGVFTKKGSRLKAYVFPTNEELLIARDTVRVIEDAPRRW